MSESIPFESQLDPQIQRGCGAACLAMVYKSFGKDVQQAAIWPLIAKPNRFGVVSSTTHLMALHAISQGFQALAIQARHPIQVLRICRENGIRAILNQSLQPGVPTGHYTVLVDIDDKSVVLHDPYSGPARRMSHAELTQLWQPSAANSEITGNVLIAIAADVAPIPACEFCRTAIPAAMACPRCAKPVALSPAAALGCVRDGCIARMWNYVACPACDFLFNESGKSSGESASAAYKQEPDIPPLPDLEQMFAELDKFCNLVLSAPGAAEHPEVRTQIDFLQASKDTVRQAQAQALAEMRTHLDRVQAFAAESRKKAEEHRKKVAEINAPLPPLDGNALGAALLKNLGFR